MRIHSFSFDADSGYDKEKRAISLIMVGDTRPKVYGHRFIGGFTAGPVLILFRTSPVLKDMESMDEVM